MDDYKREFLSHINKHLKELKKLGIKCNQKELKEASKQQNRKGIKSRHNVD